MTVSELHARMSGAEFDEWRLYAQLEPFGEWRADYRAALVASTVFNMNRGSDVQARAPGDFMPRFDAPPPPPPDPDAIRKKLMAWMPPPANAAA